MHLNLRQELQNRGLLTKRIKLKIKHTRIIALLGAFALARLHITASLFFDPNMIDVKAWFSSNTFKFPMVLAS
jgi:hypothetical protein